MRENPVLAFWAPNLRVEPSPNSQFIICICCYLLRVQSLPSLARSSQSLGETSEEAELRIRVQREIREGFLEDWD